MTERTAYPVSIQTVATVRGFECNIIINAETGAEARAELLAFAKPENIQPTHNEKGERTVEGSAATRQAPASDQDDVKASNADAEKERIEAEKMEKARKLQAEHEAAVAKEEADKKAKADQEAADRAAAEQAEKDVATGQPEDGAVNMPTRDEVVAKAKTMLSSTSNGPANLKAILAHPAVNAASITVASDVKLHTIYNAIIDVIGGATVEQALAGSDDNSSLL